MKTLLIRGDIPLPPRLHDIVRNGSTELKEVRLGEERDTPTLEADRIVVWDGRQVELRSDNPQRDATATLKWPEDEDKLRMFFETGG